MTTRRNPESPRNGEGNTRRPAGGSAGRARRKGVAPSVAAQTVEQPRTPPRPGDIARRAFLLYLQRGAQPGHDVDDWLQAERELAAGAGDDVDVA